jgi:hypothetical protein
MTTGIVRPAEYPRWSLVGFGRNGRHVFAFYSLNMTKVTCPDQESKSLTQYVVVFFI